MRKSMWMTLIAVLAVAGWMSTQGEDELVAPSKSGKAASRPSSGKADRLASRGPTSSKGASKSDAPAADTWVARSLIDGVKAWQQRTGLGPLDAGAPLAWAGNAPPPPPPAPYVEPPPPPPPVAPPFPHRWVGRFIDEPSTVAGAASASSAVLASPAAMPSSAAGGVQRAVLAGTLATWVVKAGDVIEGQWRIDQIQDRQMRLTYLPLKQSLSISMN